MSPSSVGWEVSVAGFGMTNTSTQLNTDILQMADMKVFRAEPHLSPV